MALDELSYRALIKLSNVALDELSYRALIEVSYVALNEPSYWAVIELSYMASLDSKLHDSLISELLGSN